MSAVEPGGGARARAGRLRSRRWSWPVVVGRLALLLCAAAAAGAGAVIWRSGSGVAARERYVCSMHPEVSSAVPGTCPICGMALARPRAGSTSDGAPPPSPREEAAPTAGGPRILQYEITIARLRAPPGDVRVPAWLERDGAVTVLCDPDQVAALEPPARVSFVPTAPLRAPPIPVRRTARPPEPWDEARVAVELRVEDGVTAPPAGGAGWIVLPGAAALVVPDPAIVRAADGPYVWVAPADGGAFEKRPVKVGRGFYAVRVVLAGLAAGERVVVGNAFFLDAERRLHAAAPERGGGMP